MDTSFHPPLDWSVRVDDVPARGLIVKAKATPDELRAVAAALDLRDLKALTVDGRIEAAAGGLYHFKGRLKAEVVQACVVSLEPVASVVDEPLTIEFRPENEVGDELAETPKYGDEFDVEPITRGQLETGRVIYEQLSASLDPYPRAAGAGVPIDLATKPKGAGEINPFAVLAKLKDKS